ncbi:MAG: recombinase family protein [Roseburia sp.]
MRKRDDCIAIYSRKSRFTGKGESIGNQIELCKEYIEKHYGQEALENIIIYEDEGFSGKNLNRPDFKKMMDAAKKHGFRAIIVYRLDRISRNISDFAGLIEELSRLDIAFVSIKEQFDTGTPMGRAMMYIASVFSQLERETIAERIRDNMRELAKTGCWLGGTTPTGYASEATKSITVDGKSKKFCRLKLIPKEAVIVKLIYDLYLKTDSQTMTEAELIKRGIRTKNKKYFTRFSIKAILQNPVYLIADEDAYHYFVGADANLFSSREDFDGVHGMMVYNRTEQGKGKATVSLPPSEWIVSVGRHPGLIPGKMWVEVQESIERNKGKAYHKPRSNEALLTGLLYCSCGSRMYPRLSGRKTTEGKAAYTYVCKLKERSRRSACSGRNVNGNVLDDMILEQISMLEESHKALIKQLQESRRFYTDDRDGCEEYLAQRHKEKEALEKKVETMIDSLVDLGDCEAKSYVAKRIEQLSCECADLDAHIRRLEEANIRCPLGNLELDATCQLLSAFQSGLAQLSIARKRSAVRMLVSKVLWDGVNAHVVFFGAKEEEKTHWGEDSK